VESFPCGSKDELTAREARYIKTIKCLNKVVPMRTTEEYKIDNREQILINKKEYYDKNKERILLKAVKYRDDNKEAIALTKKKYYDETKHINIICECGKKIRKREKAPHIKTKFHLRYLDSIVNIEPHVWAIGKPLSIPCLIIGKPNLQFHILPNLPISISVSLQTNQNPAGPSVWNIHPYFQSQKIYIKV
jgi:hypothetical protein